MDCLPQLHTIAIHAEAGYQPDVPGLGVFCRDEDLAYGLGRYKNSIGAVSNYFAVGFQPWRMGALRYGFIGGAVNGYSFNDGGYMPMAAGLISFPQSWGEAHLIVIPLITGVTPLTIQLSFTMKYK